MYKHILIAVDFSDITDHVIKRANELARGAHLTLIHVVDYLPPLGFGDDFTPAPTVLIDEQMLMDNGARILKHHAERHHFGPEVDRLVRFGTPRQEIVAAADQRAVDLIVIGSHGRHGLRRLLGSTASAVLNDAVCDVLAVRAHG
ncbi:MAG: universal stress protein [Chromatiales bacterium]|jgi:universal stress protein A|nr:universal stress protein [Chromatiales bacterium]